MKGGVFAHVIANKANATKPKRNVYRLRTPTGRVIEMDGHGKDGQTFDVDRLARLCNELKVDPCRVAALGLSKEHTPTLTEKERTEIGLKLMEYLMPKRRAIEADVEVEHTYVVSADPLGDDEWESTYRMGTAAGTAESAD